MSLTLRPAPRVAPPALPHPDLATRTTRAAQAQLDLEFPAPPVAEIARVRTPGPVAQHLVQAIIEVLEARRSPLTLQRATSPTVLTALVRRAAARRSGAPSAQRPTIRRLRAVMTGPTQCEVAAVVVLGGRVRALALCLRLQGERWVVDALELG